MKKHSAVSRLKRTPSRPASKPPLHPIANRKPEIFLASSLESREVLTHVARFVKESGGVPRPWHEAFPASEIMLESLIEASRKVDGALVVASADDQVIMREETVWAMRDNVVFEFGIFMSALSRTRAALIYTESEKGEVKLPKDVDGLTHLRYTPGKPAQNMYAVKKWMKRFFTESIHKTLPSPTGGHYKWEDVHRGLGHIQDEMERTKFHPDLVLGLGRSGGVVGGILASSLGSIPIRLWDLKYTKDKNVVDVAFSEDIPQFPAKTKRVLVIEGATTSGQTPKKAKEFLVKKFPKIEFKFVVLIQSVTSIFHADYYAYEELGALEPLPWHGRRSRTFLRLDSPN